MPEVVHVLSTPEGVGGAERVVASIIRHRSDGWRHRVLNPFARDSVNEALAALCSDVGAEYHGFPCASARELPAARRWLACELQRTNPQVVHAHLFHALVLTASVRWNRNTAHLMTHHHGNRFVAERQAVRAAIDRRFGARYPTVIAVSEWTRRFLLDRYGYQVDQVRTIRNGWEGEPLPRPSPGTVPTVISVARLRRQKGHDTLIAAFARVAEAIPNARLVLVGEGELRSEIIALVRSYGVEHRVAMVGQVDDVWTYLRDADVFVLASHYEPLGIALLEAMAAGVPVVASDIGGIPEIVQPGQNGLLFPVGDAVSLSEHLLALLVDPQLRNRLAGSGRRLAMRMTMKRTASAYQAVYQELIAQL